MATVSAFTKLTQMSGPTKLANIRVARRSPDYWLVMIAAGEPPIDEVPY